MIVITKQIKIKGYSQADLAWKSQKWVFIQCQLHKDWPLYNFDEYIIWHVQEAQQTSVKKSCMQKCTYCVVLFTWNVCKRYICRDINQISFCLGLRMGEEINWNGHGKIFRVMEIPKTGLWWGLYNSKQWKSFSTHLQWVNLGVCLYFFTFLIFCVSWYMYQYHQFSHSFMSDSLWLHGLQHARLPFPSPTPGACSDSCLLSQWWRSFWLRRDCLSLD